jgi:hypothetical protein
MHQRPDTELGEATELTGRGGALLEIDDVDLAAALGKKAPIHSDSQSRAGAIASPKGLRVPLPSRCTLWFGCDSLAAPDAGRAFGLGKTTRRRRLR